MQSDMASNIHVHQIETIREQYSSFHRHIRCLGFQNNSEDFNMSGYVIRQTEIAKAFKSILKTTLGGCIDLVISGCPVS